MCNKVKELRHAFEDAERLNEIIRVQREREMKKQSKLMAKMRLREKSTSFAGRRTGSLFPKNVTKENE